MIKFSIGSLRKSVLISDRGNFLRNFSVYVPETPECQQSHTGCTGILFISHVIYDIMILYNKGGNAMDLMKQSYKFDITTCLKQLNHHPHQNICHSVSSLLTHTTFKR